MKIAFHCFFLLLLVINVYGQDKKTIQAYTLDQPLKIDGYLDEAAYSQAQPAKDFVQLQPYNGRPAMQPSEVYIMYDQTAVYVGGMFYDSPDSIYNYLSERDNIGRSDYFGVYFDPYNQGQLAYGFFITPAGVQTDIKAIKTAYDNEDDSWDAVWESKTRVTDKGWIVEMK
ncbi:MAG: carbohydrate binding family 9 domain-containing protein, partial [Bacteroidales bacterium]|nr:carbohydrate binding family 9 domain-containing protein [Bacteroidales bacterium]